VRPNEQRPEYIYDLRILVKTVNTNFQTFVKVDRRKNVLKTKKKKCFTAYTFFKIYKELSPGQSYSHPPSSGEVLAFLVLNKKRTIDFSYKLKEVP
jgi:hypothetical protein